MHLRAPPGGAVSYLLPALAAAVALAAALVCWMSGRRPPRCRTCQQRIRGSYAADPEAVGEASRWRCWPTCTSL